MDFDTYTNAALLGGGVADDPYAKAIGKNLPGVILDDDVLDAYKRLVSARQKKVKPTTKNTRRTRTKGGGIIGALLKLGFTIAARRIKDYIGNRKEQKAEIERLKAKKAEMGGKRIRGGSFKSFISDLRTMFATPLIPLNVALLIKKKQREKEIAKLKKEVGEGGSLFGPEISPAQKKYGDYLIAKYSKKKATGGGFLNKRPHFSSSEQEILKKYLGNRVTVRTRPSGGGTVFNESVKEKLLNSKKPIPNGFDINQKDLELHERIQELLKNIHPHK